MAERLTSPTRYSTLRTALLREKRTKKMTLEEFAVLEAIESDITFGLNPAIVEKLRQLGLVYGDQGAAALFLTENARTLLKTHRGLSG